MTDSASVSTASTVSVSDLTGQATDPMLRQFVLGRDIPCPVCDYNLRDLTTDRCPECGERLTLRLGQADPKLGPWLGMLVPILLGAGIGILFVLLCTINSVPPPSQRLPVFSFFAYIPLAFVAMRSRRRFSRASPVTRWAFVAAANLTLAAVLVWLFVVVS